MLVAATYVEEPVVESSRREAAVALANSGEAPPLAPKVAGLLEAMETDLLAYTGFPKAHWSKIWSNNPIERLNRELRRRINVVSLFSDAASVIRLVGALLVEINDEMIAAERRYISAASVAEIDGIEPDLQSLPAASRD